MKRTTSLILSLVLVLCMIPNAFAASSEATEAADALNALGLFSGTGTDSSGKPIYDLDRAPTREEAVTMLVRLLGKESEAKAGTWATPFTDVADWAKPYVGYAYANGLTTGTGTTTFSGDDTVTASQYLTFVLRALGYESGTDFQWDKAWELSDKIGMTAGEYNAESNEFLRANVALISHNALDCNIKEKDNSLLDNIKTDTELPGNEENKTTTVPKRDDEETAFGDKAIKDFLLSLSPSNCEWQMGGYFDHYEYQDRFIADELYDEVLKYIECIEVKEEYKKSTAHGFLGTRVTCTDNDYYGRNVGIQTFSEDGMYYAKYFYIRLESR